MRIEELAGLSLEERVLGYTKLEPRDGVARLVFANSEEPLQRSYLAALMGDPDNLEAVKPVYVVFDRDPNPIEVMPIFLRLGRSEDFVGAFRMPNRLEDDVIALSNEQKMVRLGLPLCALTLAIDGGRVGGIFQWTVGNHPAASFMRLVHAISLEQVTLN